MNKSTFKPIAILMTAFLSTLALGACVSSGNEVKDPTDPAEAAEMNYQLGARYFRQGTYDFARDRLLRALEFDPKNPRTHYTLALTYQRLENRRLAAEHFELAVRYAPKNVDALNAYAVFLCQQGSYDEARRHFDRAIDVRENDNREVQMTNAGVCMASKPDYAVAEEYFRAAVEFKPSYGEPLFQLAALKHREEDNLTARAFLQRYMARNARTPEVLYLCSEIEKALGDNRASTDCLDELLRDFPESAQARYVLEQR